MLYYDCEMQLIRQPRSGSLLPNVLRGVPAPIAREGKRAKTKINCFRTSCHFNHIFCVWGLVGNGKYMASRRLRCAVLSSCTNARAGYKP